MKILNDREIEIYGEEGARLTAIVQDGVEGIRLRLHNDWNHASVLLDADETAKLSEFVATKIPRDRKTKDTGLAFTDGDGNTIQFRPDNMGEPFREGLSMHLEPVKGRGASVFLVNYEAVKFGKFLAGVVPAPDHVSGRTSGPRP